MRRVQQNLGEKRVLLGSVDKKNNLRITYERLNIEEKAFISSTKFNRRQLLSRQNKLRQLQNNKTLTLGTRPNLPGLPRASESVVRSYSNNLTLPQFRNNLRSPGKGKRLGSLLTNNGSVNDVPHNLAKHDSNSNLPNFKDVSGEKRNGIQTTVKAKKSIKTDSTQPTQVDDPVLHVGDIIAYSTSFGKREEKPKKGSSHINSEDKKIKDDQMSKQTNESKNSAVGKQTFWKNELNSSTSSERIVFDPSKSLKNEDADSIEDIKHSDNGLDDVFLANVPRKESAMCGHESDDRLSKDNFFIDAICSASEGTSVPAETKSRVPANTKTKESNVSKSFTFVSPQTEHSEEQSDSVSTLPPLVSRTPSWNGTEALPALGRIRRGSFCDVKTFTSGKVLDLLSSCGVPNPELPEKKGYGQFLEVDSENLKYCRYLRSVTPEAASTGPGEESQIPQKYRPSKNIIIGHTKFSLLP